MGENSLILFKLEQFFRKYNKLIIASLVGLIGVGIFYQVNSYLHQQMLLKTNEAYNKLLVNPKDKKALKILEENQPLYRLYQFQKAQTINEYKKLEKKADVIGVLSLYQDSLMSKDTKKINNYTFQVDALMKDLALFNLQGLYLENKEFKKAQEAAKKIDIKSDLQIYSKALSHYGIVEENK